MDGSVNQSMATVGLFQTAWPRAQEQVVFSKHTVIYISHMSQEHLKENQLII